MFEKHLWKRDILSKDAGRWPASLFRMPLFRRCFSNILLAKKQLPGLSVNGTLVENELISKNMFNEYNGYTEENLRMHTKNQNVIHP